MPFIEAHGALQRLGRVESDPRAALPASSASADCNSLFSDAMACHSGKTAMPRRWPSPAVDHRASDGAHNLLAGS